MRFRDIHANLKIRLLTQFLTNLASTMIIPFLPIYFAGRVGEAITGLAIAAVTISGVAGGLIGGFYADRLGRRRLLILSEALIFFTYVLIACANSPWLDAPYMSLALFVVNMFFSGLFIPVSLAMVLDVSEPPTRKFIFAIMYWANNLAIAIGGIAGAFLFQLYRFELFVGVTAVALFSLLMTLFYISETYTPPAKTDSSSLRHFGSMFSSYKAVFKDRIFILFTVASLLILSLENQLHNYIGVRLQKEMGLQPLFPGLTILPDVDGIKMLGFLKTENTLLVVLCGAFVAYVIKRFEDKRVMNLGFFVFTIGYVVLGLSNTPWVLLAAMLVATVGELMYVPIKQALLGEIAPGHARSSYMAVYSLIQYGAMMLGALFISIGGFLSKWVMGGLLLGMGSIGILLIQRVWQGRKKADQTQGEDTELQIKHTELQVEPVDQPPKSTVKQSVST